MRLVNVLRLRHPAGAMAVVVLLLLRMDGLSAQNAPQSAPASPGQPAISGDPEAKPYDQQIYQLAELIGAVHYLRELCGAEEGQAWRNQMRELVSAEGTTALRRARLVESFNKGYRGYARTYRTCTKPALVAIDRFMEQGASIADGLIQSNR
jgi:uncharacterized protein (TIGR02301 family)